MEQPHGSPHDPSRPTIRIMLNKSSSPSLPNPQTPDIPLRQPCHTHPPHRPIHTPDTPPPSQHALCRFCQSLRKCPTATRSLFPLSSHGHTPPPAEPAAPASMSLSDEAVTVPLSPPHLFCHCPDSRPTANKPFFPSFSHGRFTHGHVLQPSIYCDYSHNPPTTKNSHKKSSFTPYRSIAALHPPVRKNGSL